MRRHVFPLIAALALGLSACATAPEPMDELSLAGEVFALSGGFNEARQIIRLGVPFAMGEIDDVGERCRRAAGGSGVLSGLACEFAEAALGAAQAGRADLVAALDREFDRYERHAAQALADAYTVDELRALRAFYASPEGRSIAAKRSVYWTNLAAAVARERAER